MSAETRAKNGTTVQTCKGEEYMSKQKWSHSHQAYRCYEFICCVCDEKSERPINPSIGPAVGTMDKEVESYTDGDVYLCHECQEKITQSGFKRERGDNIEWLRKNTKIMAIELLAQTTGHLNTPAEVRYLWGQYWDAKRQAVQDNLVLMYETYADVFGEGDNDE